MGMFDDATSNMDEMRQRYEELRTREQNGDLDDRGRDELSELQAKLGS